MLLLYGRASVAGPSLPPVWAPGVPGLARQVAYAGGPATALQARGCERDNSQGMLLRREMLDDRAAIAAVHAAAFARTLGVSPAEARLVDALRDAGDLVPALSILATLREDTIGHVACSRAHVGRWAALSLAPLGVVPAHQRRGVGQALMHAVLAAADALDEPVVAVLGDPAYYGRFGFVPAHDLDINPPNPRWAEHFQVRRLTAWSNSIRGPFRYAPAFAAVS